MTEPKQYFAQAAISRESIVQSNDMVLVRTEQKLLAELYVEADMPRDFRIQFRYDPLDQMDSILCVARLTVIDPTNPRIEEDKDWFKWLNNAPVREGTYNHNINSGVSQTINAIYAPVIKKQLEEAAKYNAKDLATFDALSGLDVIKKKVQRDMNGYDDD